MFFVSLHDFLKTIMENEYKVSFCIVLYNQPMEELKRAINSLLLYNGKSRIFLVDNSATDERKVLERMADNIEYHWMDGKNLGFGKANNIAIRRAEEWGSKYHFTVNPDIFFNEDVIGPMSDYMEKHPEVGAMMPQILFPDGTIQYLPKMSPTPAMLLFRKLKFPKKVHEKCIYESEMHAMKPGRIYDVVHVTGCFNVYRMDLLTKLGGFDDRFFLYFEDTDLARRAHAVSRTIINPAFSVYHNYGNGAAKSIRLFLLFFTSAAKFFCKWGWIYDPEGRKMNKEVLRALSEK